MSNSVKDHSGRSKAAITVSALMQVERRLSAWAGGREKASQATGNSFSCSYTYACFAWEYWFTLLPEGLPQETCTGGIIWGEVLHGISADKLWEQISRTGLALPAPLGAGDIQDVPGESGILTDMEKDSFLPLPSHAHGCDYLTFLTKVKVQADAIPCATFKFGSMQTHMQARHGPGELSCCQSNAAYLRGLLD